MRAGTAGGKRQVMRSKGSGEECLLADYQELRKIKRHTGSYLVSSSPSPSRTHRSKGFHLGCKEKRPRRVTRERAGRSGGVLGSAPVI